MLEQQLRPRLGRDDEAFLLQPHLYLADLALAGFVEGVGQVEDGRELVGQELLLVGQDQGAGAGAVQVAVLRDLGDEGGFRLVQAVKIGTA